MQSGRIFLGRLWFEEGCFANDDDNDDDNDDHIGYHPVRST
jgi:hypothetical protein